MIKKISKKKKFEMKKMKMYIHNEYKNVLFQNKNNLKVNNTMKNNNNKSN